MAGVPFLAAGLVVMHTAAAQIVCPPMPDALTNSNRDVKFSIDLAAGSIAKVKAAEVGIKTEVAAKSLFEKHPNADKIVVMQMLAATYCSILGSSAELSAREREQSWSRFQDRLLGYALPGGSGQQPSGAEIELIRAALQPLYFKVNSTELLPESRERLVQYADRLKSLAVTGIVLEGHTGPVNVEMNMNISLSRAHAVRRELMIRGLDANKLKAVGVGGSQPLASNASGYNNRVVIRIVP